MLVVMAGIYLRLKQTKNASARIIETIMADYD